MKNIFLLPTDQPSRLAFDTDENFYLLCEEPVFFKHQELVENRSIYITSSEEIKEGVNQWYLDKFLNKPMNSGGAQYGEKQNIIILTTDPTLIEDGVQDIEDDFLKWFVKNSSCEFVVIDWSPLSKNLYGWKIIIPQEEPKQKDEKVTPMNDLLQDLKDTKLSIQDSIKGIKDGFIRNTVDLYVQKTLDVIILKIETELLEKEWKELEDANLCEPLKSWDEPIQETLEEAAEKEFPLIDTEWCRTGNCEEENLHLLGHRKSFIKGAKWQAERMFSEEDMSKSFFQGWVTRERFDDQIPDIIYPQGLDYEEKQEYAFNLWFEQFKKK